MLFNHSLRLRVGLSAYNSIAPNDIGAGIKIHRFLSLGRSLKTSTATISYQIHLICLCITESCAYILRSKPSRETYDLSGPVALRREKTITPTAPTIAGKANSLANGRNVCSPSARQ
jgi:hypothetical protein